MSALSLGDVRWRSRRDPAGGPPLVQIAFLRDGDQRTDAAAAGILSYFRSLVGQPRRAYDADVPATIAGDRRLGHALAAVCQDWYRWMSPSFADALPPAVTRALAAAGVDSPSALRLRLFDLVNETYAGFVPAARRSEALTRLAESLGLAPEHAAELEPALALDAEGEAVLVSPDTPPTVADLVGRYNRAALAAVLRQAVRVVFTLHEPDGGLLRRLYALCRRLGVYCDVECAATLTGGFRLVLAGPDAVVGPPAAAGPRLATVALRLVRHRGALDDGEAQLVLRERPFLLRLDRPLVRLPGLGAGDAEMPHEEDGGEPVGAFDSAVEARLAREFAALRRQGRAAGWRLVREPAPLLAGGRVLLPDFALVRGDCRVFVEVAGFWTPGYLQRKRRALEQVPPETRLVLAVAPDAAEAFAGLPFPLVPYRDAVPVHELLAVAEAHFGDFAMRTRGGGERLVAACAAAADAGRIPEAELAALLGCHSPGEVMRVLAVVPLPEGWEHVPGVGLVGRTLRIALDAALRAAWAENGGAPLSVADVRASAAKAALPERDEALVALLERLPSCAVVRGSLFEVEVWPAGSLPVGGGAAPAAPSSPAPVRTRRAGGGTRGRGRPKPLRPALF